MFHQQGTKKSFRFILDKIRNKLTGQKTSTIFFAGKVTLAQASLSNIP